MTNESGETIAISNMESRMRSMLKPGSELMAEGMLTHPLQQELLSLAAEFGTAQLADLQNELYLKDRMDRMGVTEGSEEYKFLQYLIEERIEKLS